MKHVSVFNGFKSEICNSNLKYGKRPWFSFAAKKTLDSLNSGSTGFAPSLFSPTFTCNPIILLMCVKTHIVY